MHALSLQPARNIGFGQLRSAQNATDGGQFASLDAGGYPVKDKFGMPMETMVDYLTPPEGYSDLDSEGISVEEAVIFAGASYRDKNDPSKFKMESEVAAIGASRFDLASQDARFKPTEFENPKSGFAASLFELDGKLVMSIRGTDEGKDWPQGNSQNLGLDSPQYNEAKELVSKLERAGYEISHVVGHSLGGGIATAISLKYDIPATTFNASGLHIREVGLDYFKSRDSITAYRVEGELLTTIQERSIFAPVAPNAVGRKVDLPAVNKNGNTIPYLDRLNPLVKYDLHGMDYVIQSLKHKGLYNQ